MNVLVIGSGGREHALAWKISQSPLLGNLTIAPGNAGTAMLGTNLSLAVTDFKAVRDTLMEHHIDLVVIGPEAPLVEGMSDFILQQPELSGVRVIGPVKAGAMLEGSKDFAKAFMFRHHIPTARYRTFNAAELAAAKEYLGEFRPPYVLKADGLAAGKGVLICPGRQEAENELQAILAEAKFGQAGSKVVIEEYLDGIECSVFVLTDGKSYLLLPSAKDYKRIGEGDTGPNTGGMGCISPVPFADAAFMRKVEDRVIRPTIRGLEADGIPYCGFIFFGLMNCGGDPFVIEYNARLGDPETEVVIPRVKSDLLRLFMAAADGKLSGESVEVSDEYCTAVMLVSGGYPGDYEKGKEIIGLQDTQDCLVFHAGTAVKDGKTVTQGGRVLAVTSLASSMKEALRLSYRNAEKISFENMFYRRDLGKDLEKYITDTP